MMSFDKFLTLPAIITGFKNFTEFSKQYFGDNDCSNYFYLRSGQIIKVNDKSDFQELLDIVVLKRFGKSKKNKTVLDLSPKTGCFALCLAINAQQTFLYQSASAVFAENLEKNSQFTDNFKIIKPACLSAEKSVLEQFLTLSSNTDNSANILVHLNCSTAQEYDLIYQAPTKFIPLVQEFCISYQNFDRQKGYDLESLVQYICTAANYRMNLLSTENDRGTIWLERR